MPSVSAALSKASGIAACAGTASLRSPTRPIVTFPFIALLPVRPLVVWVVVLWTGASVRAGHSDAKAALASRISAELT